MQATTNRVKKQLAPVHGSARWIKRPIGTVHYGRLAITSQTKRGPITTEYDGQAVLDTDGVRIIGWVLVKDDDEMYHIDLASPYGWHCECGDCEYRNRECKHIKALKAALANAGITVPAAVKPAAKPIELEDL